MAVAPGALRTVLSCPAMLRRIGHHAGRAAGGGAAVQEVHNVWQGAGQGPTERHHVLDVRPAPAAAPQPPTCRAMPVRHPKPLPAAGD